MHRQQASQDTNHFLLSSVGDGSEVTGQVKQKTLLRTWLSRFLWSAKALEKKANFDT